MEDGCVFVRSMVEDGCVFVRSMVEDGCVFESVCMCLSAIVEDAKVLYKKC